MCIGRPLAPPGALAMTATAWTRRRFSIPRIGSLPCIGVRLPTAALAVLLALVVPHAAQAAAPTLTRTDFATPVGPYEAALGDLNHDGKLDLAIANYSSSSFSVMLNTGSGAFGART